MKRFPAIRLTGNQDVAAAYIRRGKIELWRTKEVRQKMDVPVYQRIVKVDDYTTIRILLEKEQEFIFIHTDIPEEKVEEVVEEEKKKELVEPCIPAFIVYKNEVEDWDFEANPHELIRPTSPGYKLTYENDRWRLDDVPWDEKYAGNAAWWHLRKRYSDYYDKRGLKYCSLVTWVGSSYGAFTQLGANQYSNYVYFEGKRFNGTWPNDSEHYVLGACLLPVRAEQADYFYMVTAVGDFNYANADRQIVIRRIKRNSDPDTGPTSGLREDVATITAEEINDAVGGVSGSGIRQTRMSAYIDAQGFAYVNIGVDMEVTDKQLSIPDRAYITAFGENFWVIDRTVPGEPPGAISVAYTLKIELFTGDWEISEPSMLNTAPSFSAKQTKYMENFPIVDNVKYGDSYFVYNPDGPGDNDLVVLALDNLISGYKTANQVVRASFKGEEVMSVNFGHNTPTKFGFFGGCDALYEYGFQIMSGGNLGKSKGEGTAVPYRNADYDPADPVGHRIVRSVPFYEHTLQHTRTEIPVHIDLVEYKNGEESWRFRTFEAFAEPWTSWVTKRKPYASWGYAGEAASVGNCGPYPGSSWPTRFYKISEWFDHAPQDPWIGTFCNGTFSRRNPVPVFTWIKRRITFRHPMIPDIVGYIEERETNIGGGTITNVSYHFDGETKWSITLDGEAGTSEISNNFSKSGEWDFWENQVDSKAGYFEQYDHRSTYYGRWLYGNTGLGGISNSDWINPTNFATGLRSVYGTSFVTSGTADLQNLRIESDGRGFAWTRVACAIHQKSFGPNKDEHPYLLYIHHPVRDETTESGYSYGNYHGAPPEGEFVSNCLTVEQIKKLTGEDGLDKDYPVSFGVI